MASKSKEATEPSPLKTRGKGGTSDNNETIERILNAAEEEFAEKGVFGARVDQIAKRADVAKALIYYYFNGKEELLKAVIKRTFEKSGEYKRTFLNNQKEGEDTFDALSHAGATYIGDQLNVFRIMMVELLRKENTGGEIFTIMDDFFNGLKRSSSDPMLSKKLNSEEVQPELFFFGSIPLMLFLLLEDKWLTHYQIDRAALRAQFFSSAATVMRSLLTKD
jgi:AcrR family transcriptional regulator